MKDLLEFNTLAEVININYTPKKGNATKVINDFMRRLKRYPYLMTRKQSLKYLKNKLR